jgi:hypothetical protein
MISKKNKKVTKNSTIPISPAFITWSAHRLMNQIAERSIKLLPR